MIRLVVSSMDKKFRPYYFLILMLFTPVLLQAQDKWQYSGTYNMGVSLNLTYGPGQKFPGVKVYGGLSLHGIYNKHVVVNYGPSISIYTKTIGANLNPLEGDMQIDFTNSFSAGYAWGSQMDHTKNLRTMRTGDWYNMVTNARNAVIFSSNVVLNNHGRNQVVGSMTATIGNASLNFYNDGGFPFDKIPLGDNFDRYWTGGMTLFFHNNKGYNIAEASFDQFTGYTPLLYEVSNILGIRVPLYDESPDRKGERKRPYTFNTSSYHVKVFLDRNYAVDAGMIGALMKNGVYFGVQDIIHKLGGYPMHPNNDPNRIYVGGSYINQQNVRL